MQVDLSPKLSAIFGSASVPLRKTYSVRFLGPAEQDLSEIYEYVTADNIRAAERLLTRIEKDLNTLAKQPTLGRLPRDPDISRLGYRYLIIGEYLAFYRLEGSVILVYRIIHGARDYSEIL
jgi:toxin ParE1/3/4